MAKSKRKFKKIGALEPCPFCGKRAFSVNIPDSDLEKSHLPSGIGCRQCHFMIVDLGVPGDCVARWNRRSFRDSVAIAMCEQVAKRLGSRVNLYSLPMTEWGEGYKAATSDVAKELRALRHKP